jgi:hypothetical protein
VRKNSRTIIFHASCCSIPLIGKPLSSALEVRFHQNAALRGFPNRNPAAVAVIDSQTVKALAVRTRGYALKALYSKDRALPEGFNLEASGGSALIPDLPALALR